MWKAPLANVTHGIVRNYTIQYRRVNCDENNLVPTGNSSWNTTETGTNGTEWTLTNLNYWSCYEVKVAAVTVDVGMFSETRTMRTLENGKYLLVYCKFEFDLPIWSQMCFIVL